MYVLCYIYVRFFVFFWLCCIVHRIFVPQSGIKPCALFIGSSESSPLRDHGKSLIFVNTDIKPLLEYGRTKQTQQREQGKKESEYVGERESGRSFLKKYLPLIIAKWEI